MKITQLIAELESALHVCGDVDIKVVNESDLYSIERFTDMNEVSEWVDYIKPDVNVNGSDPCIVIEMVC